MANQANLNRVAEAFEHWRQTRINAGTSIPDALRQQAVDLLEHYRQSQITKTLRISGGQLKHWREQFNTVATAPAFVTLPTEATPPPPELNLELTLPGGGQLRLSGDIRSELLCALTRTLMPGADA